MTIIAGTLFIIFLTLSAVHVHWALGGDRSSEGVVPEVDGEPAFVPGRAVTMLVIVISALAVGLALLAPRVNEPRCLRSACR